MTQRIGILTLPLHTNYGGILQAVALTGYLTRQGAEVILLRKKINRPTWQSIMISLLGRLPGQNIKGIRERRLARDVHRPYLAQYIPNQTRHCRSGKQLARAIAKWKLETVIVGSDQVWRNDYLGDAEYPTYFLDLVPDEIKKVSYAASFGKSTWDQPQRSEQITNLLKRFDAISVREFSGCEICADILDRPEAHLVLDPTLMMPAIFYEGMIQGGSVPSSRKVLMKYVLDGGALLTRIEEMIGTHLGPDYVSRSIELSNFGHQITVPEWLRRFREADFVITDSFHGMAISIIFEKQFLALVNKQRGADRFTTLAAQLGLENRLIFTEDELKPPSDPIDYVTVSERLDRHRAESAAFLSAALDKLPTEGTWHDRKRAAC